MKFTRRPWTLDDVDSLVKYGNSFTVAQFMTNQFPHPYTAEHAKAFIRSATQDDPVHIFAIDIAGEAAGGIGLHPQGDIYCKNAELGYWLGVPFRGRGIMTAAIKEMVTFGFRTYEINRIFARPFGTNLASQKALEKAGFNLEGRFAKTLYKNGEYLDELVYAIRRQE